MSLEERAEGERDHQRPELRVRQLTDVCRGKVQQHVRATRTAIQEVASSAGGGMTDGMQSLESTVPWRHLVGLEHQLKDEDCIKARIAEDVRVKGRTVDEAFAILGEAVRFMFQYPEDRYAEGVAGDLGQLAAQGFAEVQRGELLDPAGRAQGDCQPLAGAAITDPAGGAVPHPAELRGLAADTSRLRTAPGCEHQRRGASRSQGFHRQRIRRLQPAARCSAR